MLDLSCRGLLFMAADFGLVLVFERSVCLEAFVWLGGSFLAGTGVTEEAGREGGLVLSASILLFTYLVASSFILVAILGLLLAATPETSRILFVALIGVFEFPIAPDALTESNSFDFSTGSSRLAAISA